MKRRDFISLTAAGAAVLATRQTASAADINLEEVTVERLQTAMKSGETSAVKLLNQYIERVTSIDKKLMSVVELNPDALEIATALDAERRGGKIRGPLHGIPVLIKDNIDTADKMRTTAGSLALIDAPTPTQDAFVVAQLRKAGAVILGKTNLSEWANFRSSDSSSGWSGRGGQTRNPYILDRSPCGSSSGTGAAIAANLAVVGVGTETDGSIVCPSSVNGIVGIKPTLGQISRSGIIPIAHSQDTAGPMCRTVTDAAILLSAMCGADPSDAITTTSKGQQDYTRFLDKGGLKDRRIGVARQFFGRNPRLDKVLETSLDAIKSLGATLVDVEFPTLSKFGDAEYEVLLYEFKHDLESYLEKRGAKYRTLADLIKFNEDNRDRELRFFGQDIMIKANDKGTLDERAYRLALLQSKVMTQEQGIDGAIAKYKVDAIVAPSNSPTWMIDLVSGDCGSGYVGSSSLAAVAGYPNVTVPAAFINELPIGISFFGPAFSEAKLIGMAFAFEQATKARRAPKYLPTYA